MVMGGPKASMRTINDARALSALPHRAVLPMLDLETGTPDIVVFQDGDDGWFELATHTLPQEIEIGFHGPRLIDMFGGGAHVSVYCGGSGRPGKIIWVVQDGDIARDYAFCNPRRMDLAPLRDHATAVEMITEQLPAAEVRALRVAVASDAAHAMVSGPPSLSPYTQRYVLTLPLLWYITDTRPGRFAHEAEIEVALLAQLGEAQLAFRRPPGSNPNLTFPETGDTGMVIQHEGATAVLPGVWGQPSEIWIDCAPGACANIHALELDGLFDAGRDLTGLRAALRSLVPDPSPETSPTPVSAFPTLAELEDDAVHLADPIAITYQLRYIIRP